MAQLSGCPSCKGFNPPSVAACLHCGQALAAAPPRRRASMLWAITGAGMAALTLMACYGAPPCDDGDFKCYDPEPDAGLTDGGTDAGR
jgi:hypothetical protein